MVLVGHQGSPRGRTGWIGIGLRKPHSLRGQPAPAGISPANIQVAHLSGGGGETVNVQGRGILGQEVLELQVDAEEVMQGVFVF